MSSLLSWPSPMRQPRNVRVLTGSRAVLTPLCCLPWTLPWPSLPPPRTGPTPHPSLGGGGVPRGGNKSHWSISLSFALHVAPLLPSAYLPARCVPPCFVLASSCSYHVSHRMCVGAAAAGVLSGSWYGFTVAPRRTSSGHAIHVCATGAAASCARSGPSAGRTPWVGAARLGSSSLWVSGPFFLE
jgi:hypothetical protein